MNEQELPKSDIEPTRCDICQDFIFDSYMLNHDLWEQAGLYSDQNAHASCVALRIGRPLTVWDFTTAPINDIVNSMRQPVISFAQAHQPLLSPTFVRARLKPQ